MLAQLGIFPNLLPKSTAQTAMRASVCEENVRTSGPRSTDPEGLILKTRDGYSEFAGRLVRAGCPAAEKVTGTFCRDGLTNLRSVPGASHKRCHLVRGP
jgi:hypothetical protein